jgi:hypothetical protein
LSITYIYQYVDDDACLEDAESLSKLGEIGVIAYSGAELIKGEGQPAASAQAEAANHRIHER